MRATGSTPYTRRTRLSLPSPICASTQYLPCPSTRLPLQRNASGDRFGINLNIRALANSTHMLLGDNLIDVLRPAVAGAARSFSPDATGPTLRRYIYSHMHRVEEMGGH